MNPRKHARSNFSKIPLLLIVVAFVFSITAGAADNATKSTQVLNLPLAKICAAIVSYSTNSFDENLPGDKDYWPKPVQGVAITNRFNEVGLRFNFFSCRSIPGSYVITATGVNDGNTRLEVKPGRMEEGYKGFRITEQSLRKHSDRLMNGIVKTLNEQP